MWKGDMSGLRLIQQGPSGETPVATLRPCRRFIHGKLVRKVLQRFDELDVSDDVIDRVGLNAIVGTNNFLYRVPLKLTISEQQHLL